MDNKEFLLPEWCLPINVSRETMALLGHYHVLLLKWQNAINLISQGTTGTAWERHFLDSLQLVPYLDKNKEQILVDMGSGGGFPALVIAIACPNITVHMVESDMRKCQFLKTVVRECHLTNAVVHNDAIDTVPPITADILTARALAPLDKLLVWSQRFVDLSQIGTKAVFLKGVSWQTEWNSIKSRYMTLKMVAHPSKTDEQAAILVFEKEEKHE